MIEERFELVKDRIMEILEDSEYEQIKEPELASYFRTLMKLGKLFIQQRESLAAEKWEEKSMELLQKENKALFFDLLPEQYQNSFANPETAVKKLGIDLGQLLSFLYVELFSQIESIYEKREEALLVHLELIIEVFCYCKAAEEDGGTVSAEELQKILYSFIYDYMEDQMAYRIRNQVDEKENFAARIIMESNLEDLRYLYRYGEYISEQQIAIASFLNSLPEESIRVMADTYTEGYRKGFELAKIDLSKKNTVNIRYSIGFERVIRKAIQNFEGLGLKPTIYRASTNIWAKRGTLKIGYFGAIPNKQMEYDHREDMGLFMDSKFMNRKKEVLVSSYEEVKDLASLHAGPACMETFGEATFEPVNKPEAVRLTEKQQKLQTEYSAYAASVVNQYIKGEERSFTIIAFPIPEIGPEFEAIFRDTIAINTLDYKKYAEMQARIIQTLDQADYVEIEGMGENHTNMRVQLCKLKDSSRETKFENCVADVNIPVGEVFTSPVLKGTNGLLHVTRVYLEGGLEYRDLQIRFEDGRIADYSCSNFNSKEENRRYIQENILFHHATLPLGEFAIGTNTTAYMTAKKYHIFDKMPILIAEKMGPHFAVGDTCYSHSEEVRVWNPDGKEIVAKDNEISLLRKTEPQKAYFGCHTDITIPYDELKRVTAVLENGDRRDIIADGLFVLDGLEPLNVPICGG